MVTDDRWKAAHSITGAPLRGGGRAATPASPLGLSAAILLALSGTTASAQGQTPDRPVFKEDGTVRVPSFDLPPSRFLSPEALATVKSRAAPRSRPEPTRTIEEYRRVHDAALERFVGPMRRRYPVTVVEQVIGGVRTRIFTPQGKPADPKRVLINIHGGGFVGCEDACSQLESVPISAVGGFKVVSVLYRMAPEAVFPAGVEDVGAVYRELLKSYKPANIGIFGCSAGGQLTAQTTAWLASRGLPRPGAIGIFGAGAGRIKDGDSSYLNPVLDGGTAPAQIDADSVRIKPYFEGSDLADPIVSPMLHPEVLAKFPPTLFTTASRAQDLSPAIFSHSQLIKAGIPGDLIVADGLGHCYQYLGDLPEAQDTYRATVNFFRAHLGN